MSGDRFKSLSMDERGDACGSLCNVGTDNERWQPTLSDVARRVQQWQSATFGPPESRTGCTARLKHVRREVDEAIEASHVIDGARKMAARLCSDVQPRAHRLDALASELADIFILLLSACDEAKMDLAVITCRKLLENRERTWGGPDADGVIEHVEGSKS